MWEAEPLLPTQRQAASSPLRRRVIVLISIIVNSVGAYKCHNRNEDVRGQRQESAFYSHCGIELKSLGLCNKHIHLLGHFTSPFSCLLGLVVLLPPLLLLLPFPSETWSRYVTLAGLELIIS